MSAFRFLHIPKTAGATFGRILARQFPKNRQFFISADYAAARESYNRLTDAQKKSILLFYGHAPISTRFPEADEATIITFLRDPLSRVKSFCQHASEGKSAYLVKQMGEEQFDLDAFLASGNRELNNLQTKMLINTGLSSSDALLKTMSPQAARDQALENLSRRIASFGLQEYFDESLILFSEQFHWSLPWYFAINQKDASKLLDFKPHHIEQISALNAIDIEVYQAARQEFEQVLNSPAFKRQRFEEFRKRQQALAPLGKPYRWLRSLFVSDKGR